MDWETRKRRRRNGTATKPRKETDGMAYVGGEERTLGEKKKKKKNRRKVDSKGGG